MGHKLGSVIVYWKFSITGTVKWILIWSTNSLGISNALKKHSSGKIKAYPEDLESNLKFQSEGADYVE